MTKRTGPATNAKIRRGWDVRAVSMTRGKRHSRRKRKRYRQLLLHNNTDTRGVSTVLLPVKEQ